MIAYLDGLQITDLPGRSGTTVAELLDEVRRRVQKAGRLLLGIRVDGDDVLADQLDHVLPRAAAEYRRLDFVSAEPRALAIDILNQAREAFSITRRVRESIADRITAGQTADAMADLAQCFSIWSQTNDAVAKTATLLGIELESIEASGRAAGEWISEITTRLRDLKKTLESGDLVLLADILRFELTETLEAWDDVMAALTRRIEGLASVAA